MADRKWRQAQAAVAIAAARGEVDTDDCVWATEDAVANIYGAMVKVAWSDFEAGYVGHGMPDAETFLKSSGLLTSAGVRDTFGHKTYRRRKTKAS